MSANPTMMGLLETYPYNTLVALFMGFFLFMQLKKGRDGNPNGLPFPPGPKGYPLIGNLFGMPGEKPWLVYDQWYKTYGDMVHFHVLGQHFLFLNTPQRTTDLFEKRSGNYSDRWQAPMLVDLMGWGMSMPIMPYGPWWRKHRRLFHEHFHSNAVVKYKSIQEREVHAFLRRLLVAPDNLFHHIRHTFAATIMKIAYGIDVKDADDPYISIAEAALNGAAEAGIVGTFWVDFMPILKYVPSWFPGAGFQRKAARWREVTELMAEKPFREVKEQVKSGKAPPSVVGSLVERLPDEHDPERPVEETVAKQVGFVAYTGGADTTVSSVQALFLAMALHPEVQKKAQAEIDAVVGPNRIPDFEDRPSLPYINAIVKETVRWHSVAPIGIPHLSINNDEYNGYYIPKGTLVIGNAWGLTHDPKTFTDPMEYQPERYLKDGQPNPDAKDTHTAAFGFGRRICPGRHLSDNSLYIFASSVLAVYQIEPPIDDDGNSIQLKAEFTTGILSYPAPFKCIIKPRTSAAEALIRNSVNEGS